MRDKDGFIILNPTKSTGDQSKSKSRLIGANRILEGEELPKMTDKQYPGASNFTFSTDVIRYHIDYKPKTWQYKAWVLLSRNLDLAKKSPFRHVKFGNRKLHHVLRIGLTMKVRSADPGKDRTVIDQFTKCDTGYGMYTVADTLPDFVNLINRWRYMSLSNIEVYREMARKQGIHRFTFVPKMFIIYDDMSFDSYTGDPRLIMDKLGLEFTSKGRLMT